MTLICETLGGGDAALPLTPLVEFCHNASLIHDDIEDNSDERRGKPAVHLLYGIDTAINGGAFLYFLPLACIDAWSAPLEQKEHIRSVWGEYMRRLHLGQAMDISWHRNFASLPSVEAYTQRCRLKTGALARLAAVLGVYTGFAGSFGYNAGGMASDTGTAGGDCAGSEGQTWPQVSALVESLGEAAEKLGVGFQILDDVKNLTTGNPGKKRGDDIVEGKKSLPVLLLLHRQKGAAALVERCFTRARAGGTSVPEVEELIGALEQGGFLAEARERGLALIAEARETLAGVGAESGGGSAGTGRAVPGNGGAEQARRLLADFTDLIS
jgi:octaprenyl-diphosphate synthase